MGFDRAFIQLQVHECEAKMLLRHMCLPNVDAYHDGTRLGWHVKLEGGPTDIGMQTFLSALLHTCPDLKKLRLVFYIIEHDMVYPFYRNVHAIRREDPESIRDIVHCQDFIDLGGVKFIVWNHAVDPGDHE
jgi:hypothetical protein